MDKRSKTTNESVHDQLVELMQDAFINENSNEYKEPEIDLSFLKTDSNSSNKKHHFGRFAKIASVAVIVLLIGGVTFGILINTDESYGDKGVLHRIFSNVQGLFTDSENYLEDDIKDSITISKEKELKKAKRFYAGLYVPHYLPEGYQFKILYINHYYSDEYMGEYTYTNGDNELWISFMQDNNADGRYYANGEGELIEEIDRKIFIQYDKVSEEQSAVVFLEDCCITITGDVSEKIIIQIAKNLSK